MNTNLPDPESAPELFSGLVSRRVAAYLVDFVMIIGLTLVLALCGLVLGFLTLGLAWLTLPLVFPAAVLVYYGLTLGLGGRATPGMALMDLTLTPARPGALDGWRALLHPVLFWISVWIFWPLLAIVFFTPRRQTLHDLALGVLMVRRSPMAREWPTAFLSA